MNAKLKEPKLTHLFFLSLGPVETHGSSLEDAVAHARVHGAERYWRRDHWYYLQDGKVATKCQAKFLSLSLFIPGSARRGE